MQPELAKFLVTWFVIRKMDKWKEKLRLISDCRLINEHLEAKHFKMDHWGSIFPCLRKNMYAAKIDLKHAYFHLGLSDTLKEYVVLKVGDRCFQFQGAAFGLSPLPQLWILVMKTFSRLWKKKGILCCIYLDDILLFNTTARGVERDLEFMLRTLEDSGMVVNKEKSILQPCQVLDHLGFTIDFKEGCLLVPTEKLKTVRKELGKLLTNSFLSCRKMAAILGAVRSFLMAMPFLRAFTDTMSMFVKEQTHQGWDRKLPVPDSLQEEVRELKDLLKNWAGRPFQGKVAVRQLHSDSSQTGWAGVDSRTGAVVQEFWRGQDGLHINVKELQAAINTVRSLAKPRELVHLSVDNSVSFAYLSKGGGRLPHFNFLMRPFLRWCIEQRVHLRVSLVKSEDQLADSLSRLEKDPGDYTMDRSLFCRLRDGFRPFILPEVDMFASPGNAQLGKFVSRHPHWQAVGVDAVRCPLEAVHHCYANPPWTLILQWLCRLQQNPQVVCLMVVPFWVSATWWPLLVKLHCPGTPAVLVPPYRGMFRDCQGTFMNAPRWPLLCTVLSGRHYKANRFLLKTSTLF